MTKKKITKNLKREVSDEKKKIVSSLIQDIKKSKTILLASTKGLPSSQFHEIKKKMRGKAEIKVVKKTAIIRAIEDSGNSALKELEQNIKSDVAIFFSDLDAFELSGLLSDSQSPAKAKGGDIAPEDIVIEPGPTDLLPGPAISELSGVGLKVAVEGGKLAIKIGKTVAKKDEVIKENVASVLAKLGIAPMKVGFEPIAAYDSIKKKVYVGIKIDKKATLEALKESIARAAGFAINLKYITKNNIGYFIARAGLEEKAITNLINKSQQPQGG
jgi:large subunit ribosomal protein L10